MEEFLANPGLYHVVRNISSYLDPKSLAQCRVICHSWKDSIDNDRRWLIFQLKHIHDQEKTFVNYFVKDEPKVKSAIKARFPKWNAFIEEVSRRQNIPILKEIVNGMWIYFKDESMNFKRNPLHHAVAKSDMVFVQLLIKSGINLEMRNPVGWTPLHYACHDGNIEMVQLLIKHTPTFDATSRTNKGWTIFYNAVKNSDPQIPKLILDTFRFEDIRDDNGWTMLHHAVAHGQKETIEFLMESRQKLGINIEEITNGAWTILHIACGYRDMEIVHLVHNRLEEINSGIDFNTRNHRQEAPFHTACYKKSDVAICLLQRFPEQIDVLGFQGCHVLHYACRNGHLQMLKFIIGNPDFDIDFNIVDQSGNTPLHKACCYGQFEVVKFLLENSNKKEIDIYKKNNNQRTAEDLARLKGHKEILELLEFWTLSKKIEAYKARLETLRLKYYNTEENSS